MGVCGWGVEVWVEGACDCEPFGVVGEAALVGDLGDGGGGQGGDFEDLEEFAAGETFVEGEEVGVAVFVVWVGVWGGCGWWLGGCGGGGCGGVDVLGFSVEVELDFVRVFSRDCGATWFIVEVEIELNLV